MGSFIKKIMPVALKRGCTQVINAIAARTDIGRRDKASQQRIQFLEWRVDELEKWVFEQQPENVRCPAELAEALSRVLGENKMPKGVNLSISKHDYMYQFMVKRLGRVDQACAEYINSGAHMMDVLKEIAAQKWGTFSKIPTFLDFASGYGRLTRFVVEMLEPEQVWIAEIKAGAVAFQTVEFGVHGILSTENPDELETNRQFDLIFVGSLFSHLPEATFTKWLQRLCDLLSDDGVLVFTVHDESLLNGRKSARENGFIFNPTSEEAELCGKDGRLAGNQYGSTFVNEDYVRNAIQRITFENKRYCRYPKAMWGNQDVYVLSKNGKDDFANLVPPLFVPWSSRASFWPLRQRT